MTEVTTQPAAALSPDGTVLVYAGDEGGLYARTIDSYDEKLLPGSEDAREGFAFSPNSRWVAFSRESTLYKVPVDGSAPPVELADIPPEYRGLAWMPGGDIVTVSERPFSVLRYPSGGGAPKPSVEIRGDGVGENFYFVVSALDDDRHVLASADTYAEGGWQMNVVLLDTESGTARTLVEDGVFAAAVPTGHLLFTRKGTLLAVPFDGERLEVEGGPVAILDGLWIPQPTVSAWFSVSRGGTLVYRDAAGEFNERLVIAGRDGGVETWSEDLRDFGRHLSVSRDGRRLAAHITNWDEGLEEIWISDVDRPRLRPFVDEPGLDCYGPVWSLDAALLYYSCAGSGDVAGVYRRPVDGSAKPELLWKQPADTMIFPGDLSPDGKWLLLNQGPGSGREIRLLPIEPDESGGRTPRTLFTEGIEFFWGARFSPDGRYLAYQSNRAGRMEVYLRGIDADANLGAETLVSADGGVLPLWAKTAAGDTFELLYGLPKENRVLGVTVSTTPSLELSEPYDVLDLDELRMRLIEPLPDGRLLIAQQEEQPDSDFGRINVVFNWFDELERRAGAAQ